MSVSAKVILLVGHDETLHDLIEFGNSWVTGVLTKR
jgi:hypothetical protein